MTKGMSTLSFKFLNDLTKIKKFTSRYKKDLTEFQPDS
ncbi:hypothetical protein BAME_11510 [Bacillus sp. M 2-6]|nr:hypothetical protein BAME_11510 [Bacillus sp. M 2-6]